MDKTQVIAAGLSLPLRKAILRIGIGIGILFLLLGDSRWPGDHVIHANCERFGLLLIAICIVGRTWCSLYIGGRKERVLITQGPYSISRNPLYFFSIIGAIGVGAQAGSIVIALTCGFIAWAIHVGSIMREEGILAAQFGAPYQHYLDTVPRILPRPSLWRDAATVEVNPRIVRTTFMDALIFLIAYPIAETFEYMHEFGWLPTLITVP